LKYEENNDVAFEHYLMLKKLKGEKNINLEINASLTGSVIEDKKSLKESR